MSNRHQIDVTVKSVVAVADRGGSMAGEERRHRELVVRDRLLPNGECN